MVNASEEDSANLRQLALAFERMGANSAQAQVMAAQLLKRARQIAIERKIDEAEALAELLAKVVAGHRGDYTGETG